MMKLMPFLTGLVALSLMACGSNGEATDMDAGSDEPVAQSAAETGEMDDDTPSLEEAARMNEHTPAEGAYVEALAQEYNSERCKDACACREQIYDHAEFLDSELQTEEGRAEFRTHCYDDILERGSMSQCYDLAVEMAANVFQLRELHSMVRNQRLWNEADDLVTATDEFLRSLGSLDGVVDEDASPGELNLEQAADAIDTIGIRAFQAFTDECATTEP